MTDQQFQEILTKYLNGDASAAECRLIDRWYRAFDVRNDLPARLDSRDLENSMNMGFEAVRQAIEMEEKEPAPLNMLKK